jgi:uncharacterized Ntn-hydrolase superfamily protein
MITPSTFSIVACDLANQAWGVAVASKFPAVGAVVPWAQAGVGAVATQSHANTAYGPDGLQLLASGKTAQQVMDDLTSADDMRDHRQVGIVDAKGESSTYTGSKCYTWAGGLTGPGYAAQGNILVGPQVVQSMVDAFLATQGELPARLYAALVAGDRAGGDRRGRQSAAILVVKPQGGYSGYNDIWIDYRVDDHPDPVTRLGELLEMNELYFGKSPEAERLQLHGQPLQQLQRIITRLGYYQGPVNGEYDSTTRSALEAFIGNENFEDRFYPEKAQIDQPVYDFLLKRFKEAA